MGLGRLVSRRHHWLVQYLALLFCLYLIYSYFAISGTSNSGFPQEFDPELAERIRLPDKPNDDPKKLDEKSGADKVLDPFEKYRGQEKISWEDKVAYEKEKSRKGPGEWSEPVQLPNDTDIQKEALTLYRANGYNAYISDMISLNRSIKDIRHEQCKNMVYSSKLPTVSVIFPFHEEHNSTLLRSVYSVINRSPPQLLKEIILVDDFSEKAALLQPFEDFLKKNKLDHIVKVLRTKKREGLIRARQLGAENAVGEVLIFLDAHSEANYNWLPPLIDPIADDYRTVVCPFVDVIDCETYELRPQDQGARGSFDWGFNYKRLPLMKKDRENPTTPFNSPVMAGGYFAISAKWFWELGGYDEGLDIWGGEQYELSFKVWQCHGRMVDAPCSRVGHIYRCKYSPFKNAGMGDFVSRNYKRVAEVWMDEYKETLYKHRPGVKAANSGDLSRMYAVRDKLKCKSFDWFMKEIAFDQDKYYPSVEPEPSAHGEIRHVGSNLCLDTQYKEENQRFGLKTCNSDNNGNGEQDIRLTRWHDIRPKNRKTCFDVSQSIDRSPVILFGCHSMKGNQLFKYRVESKQIFHPVSGQCLAADENGQGFVFMKKCDSSSKQQQWQWKNVNKELLDTRQANEKTEFE